jgi:hypothetical protein
MIYSLSGMPSALIVAALLGFPKQGTEEALLASFERRERLWPELAAPKRAIALGGG